MTFALALIFGCQADGFTLSILDATTGSPVNRARVLFYEAGMEIGSGLTDENGEVDCPGPGRFRITVQKRGYWDHDAEHDVDDDVFIELERLKRTSGASSAASCSR